MSSREANSLERRQNIPDKIHTADSHSSQDRVKVRRMPAAGIGSEEGPERRFQNIELRNMNKVDQSMDLPKVPDIFNKGAD